MSYKLTDEERAQLGMLTRQEIVDLSETGEREPLASEMLEHDIKIGVILPKAYIALYDMIGKKLGMSELTGSDVAKVHTVFLEKMIEADTDGAMLSAITSLIQSYKKHQNKQKNEKPEKNDGV